MFDQGWRKTCYIGLYCILFSCLTSKIVGTSMTVGLVENLEECFRESLDARTSSNKFFFRFAVVEPESRDTLSVKIITPSGRLVHAWNEQTAGAYSSVVREGGLYSFCIRRSKISSTEIHVFLDIEFISTGSRTITVLPTVAATLHSQLPDTADAGHIALKGKEHVGVLRYVIHDISASAIHDNTRVSLLLTTEYAEFPGQSDVKLIRIDPKLYVEALSWKSMKGVIDTLKNDDIGYSDVQTGQPIGFDITDMMKSALTSRIDTIEFMLHTSSNGLIKLFSMDRSEHEHWPIIVFEDIGISTMQEVAKFKERVFQLRSEIQQYLHRERYSRDIAESTNTRVKWASLVLNLVLIGITVGQVIYVRRLLSTNY